MTPCCVLLVCTGNYIVRGQCISEIIKFVLVSGYLARMADNPAAMTGDLIQPDIIVNSTPYNAVEVSGAYRGYGRGKKQISVLRDLDMTVQNRYHVSNISCKADIILTSQMLYGIIFLYFFSNLPVIE